MTNAALRGKPDAGNPHVRFDEGEVAPAKPRRGSLLYKSLRPLVLSLTAAVAVAALSDARAAPRRKYVIGCGFDLMHIVNHGGTRNYVKYLPELKKTGLDGITVMLPGVGVDARRLEIADLEKFRTDVSTVAKELPFSQLRVGLTMKRRFAWDDEAGWAMVAHNMGVLARFAKETGLKGFAIDEEDYCGTKQFFYLESDGEYPVAAIKARRRGAQAFAEVFREFPDIRLRCSWLFSTVQKWHAWAVPERGDDLCALKRSFGELWLDFMNGSLDVITPDAQIAEGNEERGYHGLAERNELVIAAWRTSRGSIDLIAPENRKKFLSQLSVSFGNFCDEYTNTPCKDYYIGPYAGSRVNHFRLNFNQMINCADEYVWIYGEKGTWIDWHQDLSKPPNVVTEKCFYQKTWDEQLPGFYRAIKIAKGDYSPLEEEIKSGRMAPVTDPVWTWTRDAKPEADRFVRTNGVMRLNGDGCFALGVKADPGDDVYVKCEVRGKCPRIGVTFYSNGKYDPDKTGRTQQLAPEADWNRREWTEIVQNVFVPEGVDKVQVSLGGGSVTGGVASRDFPNEYRNFRVYRSKKTPKAK